MYNRGMARWPDIMLLLLLAILDEVVNVIYEKECETFSKALGVTLKTYITVLGMEHK